MGTGIVFVVLVAIWVAYFVQYWSRRREHLATARSVEAFSEAMRVLERRPVLRAPSGDRISTAYAVSPARAVSARPAPRPQVIAKPHTPTTTSPSRGGVPRMSSPQATRPTPARRPGRTARPQSRSAPISPSRRVRGLTLLGSLVLTVVLTALAAFAVLLPWAPLVGVAAVAGSFLWVRSGVQAEQAIRRAGRGRARQRQTVRRSRPAARSTATAAVAPAARGDRAERSAHVEASSRGASLDVAGTDPELLETTEVTAESECRPDGWRPVPVPPPTYTLKARAERPGPASAPAEAVAPAAAPATTPPAMIEAVDEQAPVSGTQGEVPEQRSAAYGT